MVMLIKLFYSIKSNGLNNIIIINLIYIKINILIINSKKKLKKKEI
jgi:hypothetical protein